MGAFILYGLFVLSFLCLPFAYQMGKISGSEEMARSRRDHPAFAAQKRANRFDRSA